MQRIDSYGATEENLFTEGDPANAIPATEVSAPWLNAVQEELCAVIVAAGIELNPASNAQLLAALQAMGPRAATETQSGIAELATAAEVQAGTDAARIVTPAGLASFGKVLSANGYQRFPGGLILQWGGFSSTGAWTFPITFPNAVFSVVGTAAQNGSVDAISLDSIPTTSGAVFRSQTVGTAYGIAIGH